MPVGPGKYDATCSLAREITNADAVVLIVINGNQGDGFSVQAYEGVALALPELLENVAEDIRNSLKQGEPT